MEVDHKDNSDEEYEEEEFLVFLDFQTKIKSEALEKHNLKIKMIGFDTDEPIVQVNNKVFRGEVYTIHIIDWPHQLIPTPNSRHIRTRTWHKRIFHTRSKSTSNGS